MEHFIVVVFLLLTPLSFAGTNTVMTLADSGPGSLRHAITNALSGDTIIFDSGLSGGIITNLSGQLYVERNLTIDASSNAVFMSVTNSADSVQLMDLSGEGRAYYKLQAELQP